MDFVAIETSCDGNMRRYELTGGFAAPRRSNASDRAGFMYRAKAVGQVFVVSGRRAGRVGLLWRLAVLGGCTEDDRAARWRAAGPQPTLEKLLAVASPAAGERVFGQCAACHTIGRDGSNRAGPNLYRVMERRVADERLPFGYTYALRSTGGHWNAARMDAWLAAPARFAPGTSMTFSGLSDPLDRADVIAFLQARSGKPPR